MRYLLIILALMILPLVSAVSNNGEYLAVKVMSPTSLTQGCVNSNYSNITFMIAPNGSLALSGQYAMTEKTNDFYNYTYTFTTLGNHKVMGFCNENGTPTQWTYTVPVTASGQQYTTAQSITYGFIIMLILIGLMGSIYAFFKTPSQNIRNQDGRIIQINYKKYFKWFAFVMAYYFLIVLVWFAWNISYAYLYFDALSTFFRYVFILSIVSGIIVTVVTGLMAFITYLHDNKFEEMLNRGLLPR